VLRLYDRVMDSPIGSRVATVYFPGILFSVIVIGKLFALGESARTSYDPLHNLKLAHDVLGILFLAIYVGLVGFRAPVKRRLSSGWAALVALGGSFSLGFVVLAPVTTTSWPLFRVATVLVIGGTLWTIASMLVLGKCFGILPEVRGLVRKGPYRLVRHPVYLGEFVASIGLLLPVLSVTTVLIYCAFVALQVWRTYYEEAALSAAFPEYEEYARATSRLIPCIW